MMPETDYVLDYMKAHHIRLTLRNYLDLAYLGNPPELSAELLAELPEIFQRKLAKRRRRVV
jgi:hypothetical protein